MLSKIHVGNIDYSATEQDVVRYFAEYGTVIGADLQKDRYTGKTLGFGWVEFTTPAEAERVVRLLNGACFFNRPLRLSLARRRAVPKAPELIVERISPLPRLGK